MVGLPKHFGTKQDVFNGIDCAKNKTEALQMLAHLEGFKSTRTIKVLKPESEEKDPEELSPEDFTDAPNPRSAERIMGFSEGELETMIAKAQKKIKEF